jgi:hypothetical protein
MIALINLTSFISGPREWFLKKITRNSRASAILAYPSCAAEDKKTLAAARDCLVADERRTREW